MPGFLIHWARPDTSLGKKRASGLVLLAGLLTLFVLFGRVPTLDGARAELLFAAGSEKIECFQGECFDTSDKSARPPLLSRSWNFAESYLRLVALGATFALLVVPLVAALLLIGMGTAPAATLLFAAATGGLVRFWRLPGITPGRAIVAFGTTTWVLGMVGGLAILGIGLLT